MATATVPMNRYVTLEDLPGLFDEMLAEGFLYSESHRAETFERVFREEGEYWFSNGVVEFKIFSDFFPHAPAPYRVYNFRRLAHPVLAKLMTPTAS